MEQVSVFLGQNLEIAPSTFLAGLRKKGLSSADALPAKHADVARQMLHQEKQLALVLQATLAKLNQPARTALHFAALLPPDSVPWPWLRELTLARHPELSRDDPDEPDPWLEVRRRLGGLRLLTPSDNLEVARIHRLVAAHIRNTLSKEVGDSQLWTIRSFLRYVIRGEVSPFDWDYRSPPDDEMGLITETILNGVSQDPSIGAWMADITVDNSVCHPPYEIWLREFAAAERLKTAELNPGPCMESLILLAECFYKYGLSSFKLHRAGFRTVDDVFARVTELIRQHPAVRELDEYSAMIERLEFIAKNTSYLTSWNWQAILARFRTG